MIFLFVVERILKKLGLDDILEKEMNLWCNTSLVHNISDTTNTSIDDVSQLNILSKNSDNSLTNKITETIQNIKIKKQEDFYKSQMPKKEIIKPITSKNKRICVNSPKQDTQVIIDEDSNDEDIFVSNTSKKITNVSTKSSTLPITAVTPPGTSTNIFNNSCLKRKNDSSQTPPSTKLDTGQLARLKLSAYRCNKKPSSSNNNQEQSNILKSPIIQSDLSNIFSLGDEDDLSYLDID